MAEAIAEYDAVATGDEDTDPVNPRWIVEDMIERAQFRKGRPSEAALNRFVKVALGTGYPLDEALTRYLDERKPGNRLGLKPLSNATVNDVRTAVQYLKDFIGQDGDALCLQDIDIRKARQFRYEFLPNLTSGRAPHGLSVKTAAKHITLLSGLWEWARERGFLADDSLNLWQMGRGVPKSKREGQDSRSLFTADQVTALFTAYRRATSLATLCGSLC